MHYAVLIHEPPTAFDALSTKERAAVTAEFVALMREPPVEDAYQLRPAETATTLRLHDGRQILTDGPFADTKEFFVGIYIIDVEDLDAALAFAERLPILRFGGSVEVRAVRRR